MDEQVERVRQANDAFRQGRGSGEWLITSGVSGKGPVFVIEATARVVAFDAFTCDNDPYGEHDFGSFELHSETLFWKIDCYDRSLEFGSPDPADPAVTRRVLTILLASEY